MSSADLPGTDKPEPKKSAKPKPEKTGLADAATSSDPAVQKLMFDRGFGGDADAVDAELRKLGFDV